MYDAMMQHAQSPHGGILVISYPRIGDFVRTHTLVQLLRERHPDAPIDVMARSPTIELAALMPEVRHGIGESLRAGRLDLGARLALARQLRANRYRMVVVASRAWKAALIPLLAGIPERVGWFGEFRYPLINRPRFGEGRFTRFLDRMAPLGLAPGEELPATWPPARLVVPQTIMQQWRATAEEANDRRPILALGPGASWQGKMWPADRFAALARRAVNKGWTVWITGGAGDTPLAEAIQATAQVPMRILTTHPLLHSTCPLKKCDVYAGNDSGQLHLAAGLGTASVGIFGASDPDREAPIHSNIRIAGPMPGASLGTPASWPSVDAVEEQLTAVMAAHPRAEPVPRGCATTRRRDAVEAPQAEE